MSHLGLTTLPLTTPFLNHYTGARLCPTRQQAIPRGLAVRANGFSFPVFLSLPAESVCQVMTRQWTGL